MDHEWISVTNRLPEPNVGVLVTDGERITAATLYKGTRQDYWYPHEIYGYDSEVSFDHLVTHWMPFPPPPGSK